MTTSSGEQLVGNLLLLEETFLWLPDTCKQDKNKLESEEKVEKLMKCWKKVYAHWFSTKRTRTQTEPENDPVQENRAAVSSRSWN